MSLDIRTRVAAESSTGSSMRNGDYITFENTTTYTDGGGVVHNVFTTMTVTSVRDPDTNVEEASTKIGMVWNSSGKYFVPEEDVEAVVEFTYYYLDGSGAKVYVSLTDSITVADIDGNTGVIETVGVTSGSNLDSYTLNGDGVQNPGTITTGTTAGDTYVSVDTSTPGDWYFTSNKNGGPSNVENAVEFNFTNQSSNTLIFTNSSAGGLYLYDLDITGTTTTIPAVIPGGPTCFCRGTMIKTEGGYEVIQDLKIGDKVATKDHGVQEIKWVGFTTVNLKKREYAPIVFEAGSILGNSETIFVSPNHRFVIASSRLKVIFGEGEVLIEAKYLVDGDKVRIDEECKTVEYYHIMFDDHEIIYCANDIETESFLATSYSVSLIDQNVQNEILALFPELASENGSEGFSTRRILTKQDALVALAAGYS